MKFITKENLPYPQKLVMVFVIIITVFLATGFSVSSSLASTRPDSTKTDGPLAESLETQAEVLTVNLLGVTSYELTEIFNDIIETTPGVVKARRCQLHLDPKHPESGRVEWQVTYRATTPFNLESAIYRRLKEIAGNEVNTYLANGFTIDLSDRERAILSAIKPGQSSSHSLCFIEMDVFAKNSPTKWHDNRHRTTSNWLDYPNRGFE